MYGVEATYLKNIPSPAPRPISATTKTKAGTTAPFGPYKPKKEGKIEVTVSSIDKDMTIEITILDINHVKIVEPTKISTAGGKITADIDPDVYYTINVLIVSANGNSSYTLNILQ